MSRPPAQPDGAASGGPWPGGLGSARDLGEGGPRVRGRQPGAARLPSPSPRSPRGSQAPPGPREGAAYRVTSRAVSGRVRVGGRPPPRVHPPSWVLCHRAPRGAWKEPDVIRSEPPGRKNIPPSGSYRIPSSHWRMLVRWNSNSWRPPKPMPPPRSRFPRVTERAPSRTDGVDPRLASPGSPSTGDEGARSGVPPRRRGPTWTVTGSGRCSRSAGSP